jgi:hypothetical protein
VVDLYSRRLVGWSLADHLRAELVIDALTTALTTRGRPDGVSFTLTTAPNTSAPPSAQACATHKVVQSMGRIGDRWQTVRLRVGQGVANLLEELLDPGAVLTLHGRHRPAGNGHGVPRLAGTRWDPGLCDCR